MSQDPLYTPIERRHLQEARQSAGLCIGCGKPLKKSAGQIVKYHADCRLRRSQKGRKKFAKQRGTRSVMIPSWSL